MALLKSFNQNIIRTLIPYIEKKDAIEFKPVPNYDEWLIGTIVGFNLTEGTVVIQGPTGIVHTQYATNGNEAQISIR